MKKYGKWFYLIGVLVAALVGLSGYQADWLYLVLLLVAILAGTFYMEDDDLVHAGIRYLFFVAVKDAFGAVPFVGSYLSGCSLPRHVPCPCPSDRTGGQVHYEILYVIILIHFLHTKDNKRPSDVKSLLYYGYLTATQSY